MTRRLGSSYWFGIPALIPIALVGLLGLSGCPDNPYKASSWTKKLGGREHERAVQELEQLGDPSAITELGEAWREGGKPVRDLTVIISLARPLTPAEAKAKFVTDFEETGREASWDKAMPFLVEALVKVDDANSRSVDTATKAAEAIGESKHAGGLDALIEVAHKKTTKKLFQAQIASIRALGRFDNEKSRAQAALVKVISRPPPRHPRTVKGKDQDETKQLKKAAEEEYGLFLATSGAAINALGELHVETAAKTLILSLYRTPELASQIRRALVASGPAAKEELRLTLIGKNPEVEDLFKKRKPEDPTYDPAYPLGLHYYCGDTGELPPDRCAKVGFRDFYAALVLGDFYDMKTAPELLEALKQPALPAYFVDDQPGPTQHNSIFNALKKIGAPVAAAPVRELWMPKKKPARGAAPEENDLNTRILAVNAYPFVTRDRIGVSELGNIAEDNGADDGLRQAAAESFARLADNEKDIRVLNVLADKYFKASAEKRKEADGKPKRDADAADKIFEAEKKKNEEAKANVLKTTRDPKIRALPDGGAAAIKAATEAAKKADDAYKLARKKHKAATLPYKGLDNAAKAYKGFARMFQMHIARIEVAIRCKKDIQCYAKTLTFTPDDSAKNLKKYIKDVDQWTKEEKLGLLEGNVERAMLEIGKAGPAAKGLTDTLLDHAKSDNRLIRQSILLALPKIADVPCSNCEKKLDEAIKAGEGKTTLGDLNLETTMLRHYFGWAGGKKPMSPTAEKTQ